MFWRTTVSTSPPSRAWSTTRRCRRTLPATPGWTPGGEGVHARAGRRGGDLSAISHDRVVLGRAVEEILRLQPGRGIESLPRLSTQDITVGGTEIPAGAKLIVPLEAANRDPAVLPDPDHFDPRVEVDW